MINISNKGTDICNSCMSKIGDKIELKKNNEDFIFFIESWGQLRINEIVSKTIENIHERFDEFADSLKKAK